MVSTRSSKRLAAAALSTNPIKPSVKRAKKSATPKKTESMSKKKAVTSSTALLPDLESDPLLIMPAIAKKAKKSSVKNVATKAKSKAKAKPRPKKKKAEETSTAAVSATPPLATDPLMILPSDCVEATLICRPSKRNRSPYVADIQLPGDNNRVAICHMPNLDMGGKCTALGTRLWVVPLRDRKGVLVGSEAVSPKYGTPKCEFSARLVHVDESPLHANYVPTWVGGHPNLGELLAEEVLSRHVQGVITIPGMEQVTAIKKQVMIGPHTRADFVLETADKQSTAPPRQRIVEVKTVVDTDYCASWPVPERRKCIFVSQDPPADYQRTALFPWGESKQKGPDGERVVSTRAIKHVSELTQLVTDGTYDATILFLVIRGDAEVFKPNFEACPSFAKYLKKARDAGVQVLAKRVRWDETEIGTCHDDKWLDVVFPQAVEDES